MSVSLHYRKLLHNIDTSAKVGHHILVAIDQLHRDAEENGVVPDWSSVCIELGVEKEVHSNMSLMYPQRIITHPYLTATVEGEWVNDDDSR